MITNEEKMYQVAVHLGDLNGKGKVKGIQSNEKGYARVTKIVRGCSVIAHHTSDDRFTLDLFVSPKALERDEVICNRAIATFQQIFGPNVLIGTWVSLRGKSKSDHIDYHRYFIDVTAKTLSDLIVAVDGLKAKFSSLK